MPTIDVYAAAGTFRDAKSFAKKLASELTAIEVDQIRVLGG